MLEENENISNILRVQLGTFEVYSVESLHAVVRFMIQQVGSTTVRNKDSQQSNLNLVELLFPELAGTSDALVYDEYGKPWPGNIHGFVSVSHSSKWFAVSFSHSHVQGIDIEQIRPQLQVIEKRFLHADEIEWLQDQVDKQNALQVLWGAKEAMYKAFGRKKLQFNRDIRVSEFDSAKPCTFKGTVMTADVTLQFDLYWLKPDDESYLVFITNSTSNPIALK
jgi:phosphopantetheine--protein transferase-like protein